MFFEGHIFPDQRNSFPDSILRATTLDENVPALPGAVLTGALVVPPAAGTGSQVSSLAAEGAIEQGSLGLCTGNNGLRTT